MKMTKKSYLTTTSITVLPLIVELCVTSLTFLTHLFMFTSTALVTWSILTRLGSSSRSSKVFACGGKLFRQETGVIFLT